MWLLMIALSLCIQKSSAMPMASKSVVQPVKVTEKKIDEYIYNMEKTIEHLLRHLSFQITVLKIQARESSQELTIRELWKKNCALLKKMIKDILPVASKKNVSDIIPDSDTLNRDYKTMEHTLKQVDMTFGRLEALMIKYNQGLAQRLDTFKHQMCNSKGLTPREKKEMRKNAARLEKIIKVSETHLKPQSQS